MNPTDHPLPQTGLSQADLILERLRRAGGQWVPMPTLYRASGAMAVHSRISDLRTRGHGIEQRNEYRTERGRRICASSYRLTRDADPAPELFPTS